MQNFPYFSFHRTLILLIPNSNKSKTQIVIRTYGFRLRTTQAPMVFPGISISYFLEQKFMVFFINCSQLVDFIHNLHNLSIIEIVSHNCLCLQFIFLNCLSSIAIVSIYFANSNMYNYHPFIAFPF